MERELLDMMNQKFISVYNQRSAYWDELQFVEDSMNLRNIGRYMNVNLRK